MFKAKFRVTAFVAGLFLSATLAGAAEKALMHCFAFTVIDSATPAEWAAFAKSTDALPGKIPGIKRVWHGKLLRPLAQFTVDAEARKKLAAGEAEAAGTAKRLMRQHGVCMEMDSEATLKAYAAHPAHKEWEAVYSKVRVAGTTTFDILSGQ